VPPLSLTYLYLYDRIAAIYLIMDAFPLLRHYQRTLPRARAVASARALLVISRAASQRCASLSACIPAQAAAKI